MTSFANGIRRFETDGWVELVLRGPASTALPPEVTELATQLAEALRRVRGVGSAVEATRFTEGSLALSLAVGEARDLREHLPGPAWEALEARLYQAPLAVAFSPHTALLDASHLVSAHLAVLRAMLNEFGVSTPPPPQGPPVTASLVTAPVSASSVQELLLDALGRLAGHDQAIQEIRRTLDLSMPELGRIFRVSRQAVEQWAQRGIPAERRADVDRVREGCAWLRSVFKAERIPSIARTPARALDGRTMLQLLESEGEAVGGGPLAFLEYIAAMFSYQTAAA